MRHLKQHKPIFYFNNGLNNVKGPHRDLSESSLLAIFSSLFCCCFQVQPAAIFSEKALINPLCTCPAPNSRQMKSATIQWSIWQPDTSLKSQTKTKRVERRVKKKCQVVSNTNINVALCLLNLSTSLNVVCFCIGFWWKVSVANFNMKLSNNCKHSVCKDLYL